MDAFSNKKLNIMKYINYLGIQLLFLLMWVTGAVLMVPLIYPLRKVIRDGKDLGLWIPTFLWFYLNDTSEGRDAGDYGRYAHNFLGYYKQCAIRNSHWNLKLLLVPKKGKKENVKGLLYAYTINNLERLGYNFATYSIENKKYFRFSFNFKLFNHYYNGQFGALDNRYVFKFKYR